MMSTASSPSMRQGSLFGGEAPSCDPVFRDLERTDLGAGAWIDYLPEWVRGHETLLEILWTTTRWEAHRRQMYERIVDVPRLVASLPEDGPGHPLVTEMTATLSAHYGRALLPASLAAYRNGRDSVAFHGDRLGRARQDAIVAIIALGARRRFLLRPKGGGRARAFDVGGGGLLVIGGACQSTWEPGIPKVAHAGPR